MTSQVLTGLTVLCVLGTLLPITHSQSQYRFTEKKEDEEECRIDCSYAMDVVFVVDASGSIQREEEKGTYRNTNWDFMINFILDLIDEFTIGVGQTRVGMVTFSTNANVRIPLNGFYDRRELKAEITKNKRNWYVGGWTNMYEGIKLTRERVFVEANGDRGSIPNVIIMITDGKSSHHESRSFRNPVPQADRAKSEGAKIYMVGVTESVLEEELEELSSPPQTKGITYWTTPKFDSLLNLMQGLLKEACTEVCTPKVSGCAADITFVLDASGSIRDKNPGDRSYDNWQLMLEFVEDIVRHFTIGDKYTRVAVVTFSNNATLRLALKDSHSAHDVMAAISGPIKDAYNGGETNTHHAIEIMHKQSFTIENGDRPDKPNIAIILTDGKSYLTAPNGVYQNPMFAAERAKKNNITILVVGITNDIDEQEIRNISSNPNTEGVSYWKSPDFVEISGVVGRVINSTCTKVREATDKFCVVTTCSKTAMDLAIIIDASGSIWKDEEKDTDQNTNWDLIIDFVRQIIGFFSIGPGQTRVGVITFSNKATIRARLNEYYNKSQLIAIADDPTWFIDGETNITGALKVARALFTPAGGDRPSVPNVCILITDGHSSHHELPKIYTDPVVEADYLKMSPSRVLVVGVTNDVYEEEIRGISSQPQTLGQSYWTSPSFSDLTNVVQSLMKETCEEQCHSPPNCTLDIAFLLDSSGSIGESNPIDGTYDNWDVILSFVQDVIKFFKIGSSDTRVALITFSTGAKVHKKLDDNLNREQLLEQVKNLPYSGELTDTAEGLRLLREDVFVPEAGDRTYVPNLAILITDGKSSWKLDPNRNMHASPYDEAYYAKQAGAFIVVVGVSKNVDEAEIKEFSSPPQRKGQSYWLTPDFVEMSTVLNTLATQFCLTIPPMPDIPEIDEGDPFCWVSVCNTAVDLVFVIDGSGSIQREDEKDYNPPSNTNWWTIMSFVGRIMDFFKIGEENTRVGIVTYSNYALTRVKLNELYDKEQLKVATRDYAWYGGGRTNTKEGIRLMREEVFVEENGDRPDVPNVAIVITDGHSSHLEMPWRFRDPAPEATMAKDEGVRMFVVGVTDDVLEDELKGISSQPQEEGETYWRAPDFDKLTPLIQSLMKETCKKDCVRSPRCALDFTFLIDASSNVVSTSNNNGWRDVLDFVQEMIQFLRTGSQDTRFGVISYADEPEVVLTLKQNEALTDEEIIERVSTLPQKNGPSNTGAAIQAARQELFSIRAGERPELHNIAFLISDIYSTEEPSKPMDPVAEAGYAIRDKIEIFAMGVSELSSQDILHDIASSSNRFANRTFWPRMEFNEVINRLRNMIYQMCTTPPTRAPPPPPQICNERRDVVFAIDTSDTVSKDDFESMKTFVSAIAERLDVENGRMRVGLVLFSDGDLPQFHLGTFAHVGDILDEIRRAAHAVGAPDATATMRMIREVMFTPANGDRPEASNTLVWITDGEPIMGPIGVEAKMSHAAGIHIIAIGVGPSVATNALGELATQPQGTNVIHVDSYTVLVRKNLMVETLICSKAGAPPVPTLSPPVSPLTPTLPAGSATTTPPGGDIEPVDPFTRCPNCVSGGTCDVEEGTPFCDCPFGFAGQKCEEECLYDSSDIAFALDASTSVGEENYQKQLAVVRDIVMGMNIKEEGVRCGLLIYSDDAEIKCDLNRHKSKVDAADTVMKFPFVGGTSNIAAAIRALRTGMFTAEAGDRPARRNRGVIITDGNSDDPQAAWEEAIQARESGIELLLIGVGDHVDRAELEDLASAPGTHNVFAVKDFNSLSNLTRAITLAACSSGCLRFECLNGGTPIPVLSGCMCQCPPGRRGHRCEDSCTGKLDISLLIDTSGSITSGRFPMVLDVIASITAKFNYEANGGETRIGAVTFSDTAKPEFRLNTYRSQQDIVAAIRRVTFMGKRTNIASALHSMQTEIFNREGDRDDARNVALIFTDGSSNVNASQTIPEAIASRINGTHIIVFGVGTLSMLELKGIASQPSGENLINVRAWTEFPTIIDNLVKSTCDDLDECASNPCNNGGTCLDDFKQYWCECPLDFTGETCARRCTRQLDIVLILDLGFTSQDTITDIVMNFAQRLVHGLPIGLDRVRVGLVGYSDDAQVQFYLNSYTHKKSVLNAIAFGDTCSKKNTQAALKRTHAEMFTAGRGDRDTVKNVAVLVSDGNSNMEEARTQIEALEAQKQGIEIYVAQVGLEAGAEEISAIASDPDQLHVVSVPSKDEVGTAVDNLLEWLCQ